MKSLIRCPFNIVIALVMAGCGTAGTDFSSNAVGSLRVGMTTPSQMKSFLGKPFTEEIAALHDTEAVIYSYVFAKQSLPAYTRTKRKQLFLEFSRNVLNGYIYNNSFEDSSSNFVETKRADLILNRTTKEEARSLLGVNAGEVQLPSNLFRFMGAETFTKTMPGGTNRALVYFHNYSEDTQRGKAYEDYYKLMFLYFDSKDVLLDTTYVENIRKK